MRRPGRFEKDLSELKRWIISELEEGPKRWNELWDKDRFGSEKHLSQCLKELQKEGVIMQQVKSHKNRPYMLTEDFEAFQSVFSERFQKGWSEVSRDVLSGILREIKLSELTSLGAKVQITALLLEQLGNTLSAAEFVTRMPEKFRNYAIKELERAIEGLEQILSYFGEPQPIETKSAINVIKYILWENIKAMKATLGQKVSEELKLKNQVITIYEIPSFIDSNYLMEEKEIKKEYEIISTFYNKDH